MRTPTFYQIAAISIALTLGLAGCSGGAPVQADFTDAWGILEVRRGTPIRVAVVVDPITPEGQDTLRGASLALEDYGRVYRTDVELVRVEASCSRSGGETAAGSILAESDVAAVIGLSCSETCLGALPLLDSNHYSIVSPSCSADELTDQISHFDTFLRTVWSNTSEAQVAAEFAFFELAARDAVIIQSAETDSTDLSIAFEATFTSLGGEVLSVETAASESGILDIYAGLTNLNYDVIYAPIDAELLAVLAEAAGEDSAPLIGVRHIWSDQFIDGTGTAADDIYATGPILENSSARVQLRERFEDAFSAEPVGLTYVFAYDAMWMALDALSRSVVGDGSGALQIGRESLNIALYETANLAGLSGSVTCSQWGDCGSVTIGVGQIRDASWAVVYVP